MRVKKILACAATLLTLYPSVYAAAWHEVYWSPLFSNPPLTGMPWSVLTHITHVNSEIASSNDGTLHYYCNGSANCALSTVQADANNVITTAHANGVKACMQVATGSGNWGTVTNSTNLPKFVTNVMQLMNLGYDCLSIDWEGAAAYNQTQMNNMDIAFKAQLGTKQLNITVIPNNFSSANVMAAIQANVDTFDVMTYDFSVGSPPTWFNSPINSDTGQGYPTPGNNAGDWGSLYWNFQDLTSRGIPASKLNFGYEANGYVQTGSTGPRQNVAASASAINYNRIVTTYASLIPNLTRDTTAQMPWFQTSSNAWINYDDPTSVAAKMAWAKAHGVGLFQWEASGDYINGTHPLLSAMGAVTTISPKCDVNSDGAVNVSDVQSCVNQALAVTTCSSCNLTQASPATCNAVDVQRDVNAALGGSCVGGP